MFSSAVKLANLFTRPVIILRRYFDRTADCGCGAFIVRNEEWWILTAAHLWRSHLAFQQHAREIADYYMRIHAIQQDPKIDDETKRKRIFRMKTNPKWVTKHSFWWGRDGVQLRDARFLPEGDLVLGRLDPFEPDGSLTFPVLKDPANLAVGTSLCKLGYPFNRIEAVYDEADDGFVLAPGVLPLTPFPMEGIYTRTLLSGRSGDGRYAIKFLETSSPGLMGQSGGPIFDARGTVWAVQSRTDYHAFGTCVKTSRGGREVEESQFLNVGIGIHPELIVSFLGENRVRFNLSSG